MSKKNQRIIQIVSILIIIFCFGYYMLVLSNPPIYGCTDATAINYNGEATEDDGSCIEPIYGCTDATAINYNSSANKDDGSCIEPIYGCMDSSATNYNSQANTDDGSCKFNPLSSTEGTRSCILENGGDWCTPSCSNPSIAYKFLTDGTYSSSVDYFGGMHTRGTWSVSSGALTLKPNHAASGIFHNKSYCPNTEQVPSRQTIQLTDCNKFKIGSTVYYRY